MVAHPGRSGGSPHRRVKTLLFSLGALVVVLFTIELGARLLEGIVRARASGDRVGASPFLVVKNRVKVFRRFEEPGGGVYRRTENLGNWVDQDLRFDAVKDPATFRIFCLGGSAAKGWPHRPGFTYPGLLQEKLEKLYPGWNFEVLNVAGFCYASYRVRVIFEEIVDYSPDLVLVYSGNNEFLEDFVYNPPRRSAALPGWLQHSVLFRTVVDCLIPDPEPPRAFDFGDYSLADQLSNKLSFAFGRASRLTEDPAQLEQVIAHYRFNLTSMAALAREKQVPLMLFTVPVNWKDWVPNVSAHAPGLPQETLAEWQDRFCNGFLALERGDLLEAETELDRAAALDPQHAETWYRLAQARHGIGNVLEARAAYRRALERDAYPFRAIPAFQDVILAVAAEEDVPVVDAVAVLESVAADGILGLDVLLDYVHPRPESNEAIAEEVVRRIQESGLVPAAPSFSLEEVSVTVEESLEDRWAVDVQLFPQYLIMRQYDELLELGDRLVEECEAVAARRPEWRESCAYWKNRVQVTLGIVRPYQKLLRAQKLGVLDQEFDPPRAQKVFDDYVALIRDGELAGNVSPEELARYIPPEYSTVSYRPARGRQ